MRWEKGPRVQAIENYMREDEISQGSIESVKTKQ